MTTIPTICPKCKNQSYNGVGFYFVEAIWEDVYVKCKSCKWEGHEAETMKL